MALPLPPGLTQNEVAFLAEMEMVTVVPRQRLDTIDLLGGRTPQLRPPHRAQLPLWLALLLKKQRRANIVPPAWMHPASLAEIIHRETKEDPEAFSAPPPPPSRALYSQPGTARRLNHHASYLDDFSQTQDPQQQQDPNSILSPPFLPSNVAESPAGYLPYHWLEVAEALLTHAGDDMPAPAGEVRSLLRDLVEVRAAKMRSSTSALEGFGDAWLTLRGVGAMELAENRAFLAGLVDGVRKIGASAEATRREEEEEARRGGEYGGDGDEDSDEDMGL
ncbi:GINS complex protein-domain-containing protein [Copromyces sp. CBS 386.78]|nr:GINS complex protein-domain-containing protein [Copromyces sp. CBS 386.78]